MPLQAHLRKLLSVKKKEGQSHDPTRPRAETTQAEEDAEIPFEVTELCDGQAPDSVGREETISVERSRDTKDLEALHGGGSKVLSVIDVAIDISLILKEATEASSVLIPLKVFCTVFYNFLQTAREKVVASTNLLSLFKRLESHYTFIEEERQLLESRSIQERPGEKFIYALQVYLTTLEEARTKVMSQINDTKRTGPYLPAEENLNLINELEEGLEKGFSNLMRQVHSSVLNLIIKASDEVDEIRLTQLLKDSVNARGDRIRPITPGTRIAIIDRLRTWGELPYNTEPIFWLHDEAGTGKSAVAAHMAKYWEKEGVLAGRFFFNRNGGRNFRRLDRFCVTLAKEMSEHYPLAKAGFLETLGKHSDGGIPSFAEGFRPLVVTMAEKLSKCLVKPVLFVFDALDECHEDEVQLLTASILSTVPNCQGVRFLLTSRPTKEITGILDGISGVGGKNVVLLDVKHSDAERDHDTSIYVRHTLKGFSTADQNTVIECASGVFLWATLACDTLLRTITPRIVLDRFENNTPDRTMQILYETVLEAALPLDWSSQDLKLLHTVLQGVSLTYAPISIFAIRSFFPSYHGAEVTGEEFVEFFVKKLGSIMKDGTPYLPIYILHPTFREFIEDQKHGAKFYISPSDGHRSIAIASLALLMDKLTPNVLSLDDGKSTFPMRTSRDFEAPTRLSLDIEAPLRYAVAFWAKHMSLAVGEDEGLQQLANEFFSSKFLVWIEWSSAIQEFAEGIEGLRWLRWAIRVQHSSKVNDLTERWCSDSLRFMLRNNHILVQCGLQAWMSALVFTPKASLIYQSFSQKSLRPLPNLLTDYMDTSDTHRVLWDNKSSMNFTTFSPDGKRLLAFGGGPMRLWNSKTLKLISPLEGGHTTVFTATFSSDGSLIASGSEYPSICLWDGFTGALRETLPQRHKASVDVIKFGLSDGVIVALDSDQQILCWSVKRTEWSIHRAKTLQGSTHVGKINNIACSPDGTLLATFSEDKAIKLWGLGTLTLFGVPMIGTDDVLACSFSCEGERLVAGYGDGMIVVWNVATQTRIRSLESHSESIRVLAVSPQGRLVASGGRRPCLWDIDTGKKVETGLEGYTRSLSFNQSGSRLVSSGNRLVTLCEIRFDGSDFAVETIKMKGHTSQVHSVALSPSGRLVASASFDGTLRVWDTDLLDTSITNESSHLTHKNVTCMAISKDGVRVISAGEEGTFQIWDVTTGRRVGQPFGPRNGAIRKLVFSSSNSLWASANSVRSGGVVSLWRYQGEDTPPASYIIACEQEEICFIVFGHDNTYLGTGGRDNSIRIWQLASRCCIAKFESIGEPIHITVSDNGAHMGSASNNGVQIWDLKSQQLIGRPGQEVTWGPPVDFLTFSSDGTTLLTKTTHSIRLFDMKMQCYALIDTSAYIFHYDGKPFFSLDGKHLYYWRYMFNLASLSREGLRRPNCLEPEENVELPLTPISPLYIKPIVGRIYSTRRRGVLLAVPANVRAKSWVAHENMLAFGTSDGRVFIIRFPEEFM